MKQRIAIAMALMMELSSLTTATALDATLEVATIELLKDLQRRSAARSCSFRTIWVWSPNCARTWLMYAGEWSSATDRALRIPVPTPRDCWNVIRHGNRSASAIADHTGEIPDLRNDRGCIFASRCTLANDLGHPAGRPCDISGAACRCHEVGAA